MRSSLVSIIIPVYNVSDYIDECLESVAKQTYTAIETLIVDDCGTDDSMAKVERFIDSYQGPIVFKVLHHAYNRGLSAARNTGMDAATGEYIYFIDSDDYIYPHSIETLVNAIRQENDIDWAGGNFDGKRINSARFGVEDGVYLNELRLRSQGDIFIMAWNHLLKSQFIRKHNLRFVEGLLHEDDLWSFMLACHTPKIALVNVSTYYYRERQQSICTMSFAVRASHYRKIYTEMVNYVRECHLQDNVDAYNCVYRDFKRYYLIHLYDGNPSLIKSYYMTIRNSPYWNTWHIWKMSHSIPKVLLHFHRFMSSRLGFRYFQYIYAKCLDK